MEDFFDRRWMLIPGLCFLLAACSGPTSDEPTMTVNTSTGMVMIGIPAGSFKMGSDKHDPDEAPQHEVTLPAFLIDQHEVTHAMFEKLELPNPSKWKDDPNNPVESLRWRDAKAFCNERSIAEGYTPCYDEKKPGMPCDFSAGGYRLPTEAEWEYVCRAGTNGDYDFGPVAKLPQHGYHDANSGGKTHAVMSRKPNRWGIFGLYGNVSEWCQDAYDDKAYKTSAATDPRGPDEATVASDAKRVVRGGSWQSSASMCRVSFRRGEVTGDADACFSSPTTGFRCVRRP